MKGLEDFQNEYMELEKRLSVERYYSFLSENIEIFSPNGKYLEGVHVRYVDPKIENKKEYEVKDTAEEIEVTKPNEVLHKIMDFRNSINTMRNDKYETDSFDFFVNGTGVYEISCSKFNLGYGYISPYIYTLDLSIDINKDKKLHNLSLPFIIVESDSELKVMVIPFANKLASYKKEYKPRLFNFSSSMISEIMNYITSELSTNDWIFIELINKFPRDRYVFRNNDERLLKVLQTLRFDTRLLNVEIGNEYHYPDMPIIRSKPDNPREIQDVLTTDLISFDSSTYESYINSDKKAVVIRYPNLNGDIYIGGVILDDDFVALNSTIYEKGTNIVLENDKLVEKELFEPFAENDVLLNGVVRYISFNSTTGAYSEDEEVPIEDINVDGSELKQLEKINKSKVDTLKDIMKKGNKMMRDLNREKNKMLYAKYVNEFLRGLSEAIIGAVVTGGLVIFLAPYLAIAGGILTFIIRMTAKRMIDKREYQLIKKGIEKELQYFEEKREQYQDNPEVTSRIDKIINRYRNDLETLESTKRKKEREWEEEDMKKNIEGDI